MPGPLSVLNTLPCGLPRDCALAQTSGSERDGCRCSPLYLVRGARCCLQDEGMGVRPGAGGLGRGRQGVGTGRAVARGGQRAPL